MRRHLLTAAAASLGLAACTQADSEVAGPSINRNFEVGAFTGIEVSGPIDVTVSTGRPVAVAASGPQKLIEEMEAIVENGVLRIRPRGNNRMGGYNVSGEPARVTVSVPSLERAGTRGSGDVTIDKVAGERFEGGAAGSGDLKVADLRVKSLKLGVAGSGDIAVSGQADNANYGVSGSGSIDASTLTAARAAAGVAGSGSIRARVTGDVSATVAGSGDIDITGGAKCTSTKQGSGDISCS
jgi:hypothetical protein